MGFKKTKAFEEIRVPMAVSTSNVDGTLIEKVNVAHVFRVPPPEVRTEWQRRQTQVKGRRVSLGSRSDANWYLWLACILRVEGYDDCDQTSQTWKKYFDDAIGRIHVDNAVDRLMEVFESEEEDQEKKLEPSSEP